MWITSPSSSPDLKQTNTLYKNYTHSIINIILNTRSISWKLQTSSAAWFQDTAGNRGAVNWAILWAFIIMFWHNTWSPCRLFCYTYWFWAAFQSLSPLQAIQTFNIKIQSVLQALYTYVERQGQTANARDNVFLSFTYSSRKVPFFILSLGSNYDLKSLIFFYSRLALITPGLQLHYKTFQ